MQPVPNRARLTFRVGEHGPALAESEDLLEDSSAEVDPYRDLLLRFLGGLEYGHEEFGWPEWVKKDLLEKIRRGKRDAFNISKNFGDLSFRLKMLPTTQVILDNHESIMRRVPEPWYNRIMKNYRLDLPYKSLKPRKPIPNHELRLKNCLYLATVSPETMPPLIMKNSKLLEGHHRLIAIATLGEPSFSAWVGRSNPIQRRYLVDLENIIKNESSL